MAIYSVSKRRSEKSVRTRPVLTCHHLSRRGGLEMLFSDQRLHKLAIPAHDEHGKPVTIAFLIAHLCRHVMKDTRKELFVLEDHMYVHIQLIPNISGSHVAGSTPGRRYIYTPRDYESIPDLRPDVRESWS